MTTQILNSGPDVDLRGPLGALKTFGRRLFPDNRDQRAAARRERERRETLAGLLRYDDHLLADMGLLRSEIFTAMESPITVDAMALARQRSRRMLGLDDQGRMRRID